MIVAITLLYRHPLTGAQLTDTLISDEPLALEPRTQFDGAILGLARRFTSEFLVYDEQLVLDALVAEADPEDDDPEVSAREHYEFNIVGGWVGEGTPAFLTEHWGPGPAAGSPTELFRVRVAGAPVPQGSKRAWLNQKTHRVQMAEDQGARLSSWRFEVTAAAKEAMRNTGVEGPLEGPLSVSLTFHIMRPADHYRTGKNAQLLTDRAPAIPAKAPDVDKLARAILDSLTDARLWVDDGQVSSLLVRKRFVDRFGADPDGVEIAVGRQ